jgi:hypothetical protein
MGEIRRVLHVTQFFLSLFWQFGHMYHLISVFMEALVLVADYFHNSYSKFLNTFLHIGLDHH